MANMAKAKEEKAKQAKARKKAKIKAKIRAKVKENQAKDIFLLDQYRQWQWYVQQSRQ